MESILNEVADDAYLGGCGVRQIADKDLILFPLHVHGVVCTPVHTDEGWEGKNK